MTARHEHFMPVALLDSQFATLQEPEDEHPIIVDAGGRPTEIAAAIVHQLEERQGSGSRAERVAAAAEASTGERQ
jgi:gluconokinase